jgi:hypothetical protein
MKRVITKLETLLPAVVGNAFSFPPLVGNQPKRVGGHLGDRIAESR